MNTVQTQNAATGHDHFAGLTLKVDFDPIFGQPERTQVEDGWILNWHVDQPVTNLHTNFQVSVSSDQTWTGMIGFPYVRLRTLIDLEDSNDAMRLSDGSTQIAVDGTNLKTGASIWHYAYDGPNFMPPSHINSIGLTDSKFNINWDFTPGDVLLKTPGCKDFACLTQGQDVAVLRGFELFWDVGVPVPEPAAYLLLLIGLTMVFSLRKLYQAFSFFRSR